MVKTIHPVPGLPRSPGAPQLPQRRLRVPRGHAGTHGTRRPGRCLWRLGMEWKKGDPHGARNISGKSYRNGQGLVNVPCLSFFGDFEHHLQVFVGDYIPNSWVMFNWDIYQPLTEVYYGLFNFCWVGTSTIGRFSMDLSSHLACVNTEIHHFGGLNGEYALSFGGSLSTSKFPQRKI